MKRSKALLVSNILATLWAVYLIAVFGGAVIKAGGTNFIEAMGAYFKFAFDVFGTSSSTLNILYVILVLLCIHIITFAIGCLIGWIAYVGRKSGSAKFAATLYLIGTICFPIYLLFGLPITIMGFVGGSKQKKINTAIISGAIQ